MSDVLSNVLWTERYRPTVLADVALDEDNRAILSSYMAAGEVPHMLFVGPPGTGKTTISRILYRALDCKHLVLNASSERGIETVRQKILGFAQTQTAARWNIVFLDEADAMTVDAQTALRNMMESYASGTRFILTANKQHKINSAIQSRCQVINLTAPPFPERFRILTSVLKAEGIKTTPQLTAGYAEKYTDLRKMLAGAQRAYLVKGELPPAKVAQLKNTEAVLTMVLKKNWVGLRNLTRSDGFDPQQSLSELFYAVPDDHPKCGFLRYVLGKAVHESGFTPDPIILFLGTAAEIMEGL